MSSPKFSLAAAEGEHMHHPQTQRTHALNQTSCPDPPSCRVCLVGMFSRTNILPDMGHISTEKSATTPWAYRKFSSADAEGQQAGQKAQGLKTQHIEAQTWTK